MYDARFIYPELWMVEDGKALNGVLAVGQCKAE